MATIRPRTRWLSAFLSASVLLSCGNDEDPDPTTTSTTPPSSTPTTQSPESEVEAAYLAYWDMVERLFGDPDPEDEELQQRAIDPALSTLIDSISTLEARNQFVRYGPRYGHTIEAIDVGSSDATARSCVLDDGALVDRVTDEVVEQRQVSIRIEVRLSRLQGRWYVSEVDQIDTWDTPAGCQ